MLTKTLNNEKKNEELKIIDIESSAQNIPIHAKKWIDYTSKYGIGYVLSDGSIGVYFNDATKIIFDKNQKEFEYYEKQKSDGDETSSKHPINDYPSILEKKVTLLHHFTSYLGQNFKSEDIEHERPTGNLIYVK